jgi:transmembrane protein
MARFHATNTFLEHVGLIGGIMLAAALVEQEDRAKI